MGRAIVRVHMTDSLKVKPELASEAGGTLFSYIRGNKDWFSREKTADHDGAVRKVRNDLAEALNARHLAFLLGAGCSSHRSEEDEALCLYTAYRS